MGPRPEIHHTRRSVYRPMNQMNGDYLAQLKKPVCSELSPDFRGSTRARVTHCRQQVDLWFKDQEFTLRKINRSEDSFYNNLIQVNKEKRKLQRQANIRQQALRRKTLDSSYNAEISTTPVLPDINRRATIVGVVQNENVAIINGVRDKRVHDDFVDNMPPVPPTVQLDGDSVFYAEPQTHFSTKIKTKVLQVQKGKKDPLTLEIKENNNKTNQTDSSNIKPVKKRRKSKTNPIDVRSKTDVLVVQTETPHEQIISKLSTDAIPSHCLPISKHHRTKIAGALTMPAISESETVDKTRCDQIDGNHEIVHAKEFGTHRPTGMNSVPAVNQFGIVTVLPPPFMSSSVDSIFSLKSTKSEHLRHSAPSSKSQLNGIISSRARTDSEYDSNGKKISLVVLNKRRSKQLAKRRKDILNSEHLQLYDRNEKGEVVPAGRSFRRKAFALPSTREMRSRNKLLSDVKALQDSEADRIEEFFNKLDLEKGKSYERPFRSRPQPAPEDEPIKREAPNVGLVSLERIAAVFKHAYEPPPSGVDPGSIEAMRHCGYLRRYDLAPLDETAQHSSNFKVPKIRRSSKSLA